MPQPKENLYTIDYIDSLPEDKRVELINGVIYDMGAPSTLHQEISFLVARQIADAIDKNKGNCKVYLAPFAVRLDNTNYIEPDVSLICDTNKIDDRGCNGIPELIIEVVSPGSKKMDYFIKLNRYMDAGIFEYLIIDPIKKQILVYSRKDDYVPTSYKITDTIEINMIRNCKIDLKSLF